MRLTVIANPGNRRVRLFADAVRAAGLAPPRVLPWIEVLTGEVGFDPAEVVRIDSPGEDAEVDRRLRRAAAPAAFGEIVGLADGYRGFAAALGRIRTAADAAGARLLNDPDEILTMCDKRACHARLTRAGVAVAPALPPVGGYRELRAEMAVAGWSRVFVKPVHGSSASGVVALAVRADQVRATTSAELDRGRLFNSLTVRRYADEPSVATIVDMLGADGLHVERWLPKAGLGGRVVDLRIVVIAGRPTHVVVRGSAHPMTNLHLGGARGDLDALRRAAGDQYAAALETARAAAACFPGSLHVGVDLLFTPGWRRHAVVEVNAFGDLLPGLLVDGRDTYAEQVAVLCGARV